MIIAYNKINYIRDSFRCELDIMLDSALVTFTFESEETRADFKKRFFNGFQNEAIAIEVHKEPIKVEVKRLI